MAAPSAPKDKPRKWKYIANRWPNNFPEGTQQARCWCGDLCVPKRCDDWDDKHGRWFWMCPNYAYDKAKPKNPYDYPPSPPPLCSFVEWIDLEQDSHHKSEVTYEEQRKWNHMFELIREEEREKKLKIVREKQRLEKEKKEQELKDLHEVEREKKRERDCRAREEAEAEEDASKRKGKYPRWTQ
ncbi:hypothetical protein ACQ4PT_010109 [Festuca glaucescens]